MSSRTVFQSHLLKYQIVYNKKTALMLNLYEKLTLTMQLNFTHYLAKEFGELILCLLILEGMLNIVLRALEVCALEISLNIPFMCEEKKLMSRDQNALTTSLPLNYSFMLKCYKSPIILLMKTQQWNARCV